MPLYLFICYNCGNFGDCEETPDRCLDCGKTLKYEVLYNLQNECFYCNEKYWADKKPRHKLYSTCSKCDKVKLKISLTEFSKLQPNERRTKFREFYPNFGV